MTKQTIGSRSLRIFIEYPMYDSLMIVKQMMIVRQIIPVVIYIYIYIYSYNKTKEMH